MDVYLADLRGLADLVEPGVPEAWIKSKVISGLPGDLKEQLVAACALDGMSVA